MEQSTQSITIDERLDQLETLICDLRDDLARVIEHTREDFEDLNTEIDNRFQHVREGAEHDYARQSESMGRLERSINTDLDRIRYDVSYLEGRCDTLERGSR